MAFTGVKKRPDLERITAVLDCRSYEWLGEEDPELLTEIEAAMGQGAYPGEIGRHVLHVTGREAIADRCCQAARHVARGGE